ncbi:Helicostatins [Eumeta japonica]|uniref:Helicostatins n=1 Tax=Eumeta variegata TaxID=151549 RepID=A0A4C1SST4_EUMVA|nr:Helicostatins [Eumeta japonica]
MYYVSLAVYSLVLGAVLCAPERVQPHDAAPAPDPDQAQGHVVPLAKRSPHYDFGLGKRAYSYVSEYKRLPVYNFGLGKRTRPYSFGLGKRAADVEEALEDLDPQLAQFIDDSVIENTRACPAAAPPTTLVSASPVVVCSRYLSMPIEDYVEKRARPYSFGLGKRYFDDDAYDKRARIYDFGLGKRSIQRLKFNQKRERDNRYNFGLGKRSIDSEITDELDEEQS